MLNRQVVLKYILLHVAELIPVIIGLILARQALGIPGWLIAAVIAVWIVKDVVLFPKVWRAYAFGDNDPMREFLGLEATATGSLDPAGYVSVRGELWKAQIIDPSRPARRGDKKRVVGIKGMTLIVE